MALRTHALLILAALSLAPTALSAATPASAAATKKNVGTAPTKKTPTAKTAVVAAAPAKSSLAPKAAAKRAPVGEAAPEETESEDVAPIVKGEAARSAGDAAASAAELNRLLDKVEEGDRIAGLAV